MSKFLPIDLKSTIEALDGRHPADVLRAARIIIDDPSQWTQKALARSAVLGADGDYTPVRPNSRRAVCFCLEGAIAFCSNLGGIFLPYFAQLLDEQVRIHPATVADPSRLLSASDPTDADLAREGIPYSEPTHTASAFNDVFDHWVVLDLLDRAIIAAERDIE